MTLERNVRYAEIISAIAVIISLVFVGFEVRQSNNLAAAETALSLNSGINEQNLLIAENADLAELIVNVFAGNVELSAADMMRLDSLGKARWNNWEAAWIAHEREIIDDQSFAAYMRVACDDSIIMEELWNEHKGSFNSDFVQFIEDHCSTE